MKKAGFTLIESCLVLLIAAMVIAIGIFPQKQTVERHQEKIFYEELKNGFSYVAMKASVKELPVKSALWLMSRNESYFHAVKCQNHSG